MWLIILRGFGLIFLFLCGNYSEHDKIAGGGSGLGGSVGGGASGDSGLGGGGAGGGSGFRRVKGARNLTVVIAFFI